MPKLRSCDALLSWTTLAETVAIFANAELLSCCTCALKDKAYAVVVVFADTATLARVAFTVYA